MMIDRDAIYGATHKIIGIIENIPKRGLQNTRKDWLAPPPLSTFKRLEPLGFGLDDDERWWFDLSECTPELVWPLDVGAIAETNGEGEMSLQSYRTVGLKQVRGYAARCSRYMIRTDIAQTDRGELLTASGLMAWLGENWVEAENRVIWKSNIPSRSGDFTGTEGRTAGMMVSIAFRQRYEWAVSLGFDGSPSIRFATDPTGMKEAFKVRDMAEGKDRRAALINWVSDHWRQNRIDPDMEIYVRKHLRGTETFSWKGMNAEIIPARFDLDQQQKMIAERKKMKDIGTDRRAKVG